jgi:hypothetical protein
MKYEEALNEFFLKYFDLDFMNHHSHLRECDLMSSPMNIEPWDMLYVFKFVKEKLLHKHHDLAVIEGGYRSFNSILEMITSND